MCRRWRILRIGAGHEGRLCLQLSQTFGANLAEAAHGGSLVIRLGTPIAAISAAKQLALPPGLRITLTANALQLELVCGEADSAARYDLDLWRTSLPSVRFAGQSLCGFLFRSERAHGGREAVTPWWFSAELFATNGIFTARRMASPFRSPRGAIFLACSRSLRDCGDGCH